MKPKTLAKIKQKLEDMRVELVASIKLRHAESVSTEKEVQDEGDMAQEISEKAVNMQLSHNQERQLQQIDTALRKIKENTYGICIDTEEEIDEDRLLANPFALRTIEAQEDFEDSLKKNRMRTGGSMSAFDGDKGGDE